MSYRQIIGITGRSGSGKSTVSQFYRQQGYCVVDADEAARQVMQQKSVLQQVIDTFGKHVLHKDGTLNRKLLADTAFATKQSTERLNAITHPAIIEIILNELIQAYQNNPKSICFIDAAVIVGHALADVCNSIIVVHAPQDQSIQRIMQRDNISKQQAEKRLSIQQSSELMKQAADFWIENDSTLLQLQKKAQAVLLELTKGGVSSV